MDNLTNTIQTTYSIKLKLYFSILLSFLFSSCIVYVDNPSTELLNNLNSKQIVNNSKLNFEGFYDKKPDFNQEGFAYSPYFFYKDNYIIRSYGVWPDSLLLVTYFNSNQPLKIEGGSEWGTYKIINDTIKAVIFCQYVSKNNAQNAIFVLTYFEGFLKDSITIENWRMVKPFPLIDPKYNGNVIERLSKPVTYKFKSFPNKQKLDLSKAWINKFKNKKG